MLDAAIDAYLDSVKERAFDEPLLALLRAENFTDVHLTHGAVEFGKDVIAKRDGLQWAFQSKAGNITQNGWRELTGQLDELRLSDLSHPAFDTSLERKCVLVCTGRLTGNAPLAAQEYNDRCRARGEPVVEFWGREGLRTKLAGEPTALLRGSWDSPLIALFGDIGTGALTIDRIEWFSRRWTDWNYRRLTSLGIVEVGLIAQALHDAQRLDLACHVTLAMVRAAWAAGDKEPEAARVSDAAGAMFETYALELFELGEQLTDIRRGPLVQSPFDWACYPVRAIRTAELLGLLSLRLRERGDPFADEVSDLLAALVSAHPGCSHPLGDRYAASLIPTVLALQCRYETAPTAVLTRATRWLCQHYQDGRGLAAEDAEPSEEVARAFGTAFEHVRLTRRSESYLASVLTDLAAVLRLPDLYGDIRNDTLAVGAVPYLVAADDAQGQYLRRGPGAVLLMPEYAEEWPADAVVAAHHAAADADFELGRRARYWDQLAVQAVLRDRHRIPALRAFAPPPLGTA